MVSTNVIKYLDGRYGEFNYRCRLQDFTDDDVKDAIKKTRPVCWSDIEDYLYKHTNDLEVKAHLKGYDSNAERQEMINHIRRMQGEKND